MMLECLVVFKGGNLAVKGGHNPDPRQPLSILNFQMGTMLSSLYRGHT
jgi:hypothetical protein